MRPLTPEDFEVTNTSALVFMEAAKLACTLGRILDLRFRWPEDGESEVSTPSVFPYRLHMPTSEFVLVGTSCLRLWGLLAQGHCGITQ